MATWQAEQVGTTARAIRRAAAAGDWTRITGRTFLALDQEPESAQLRVAGVLELGRTAQLGGLGALVERGWSGDPGPWVDVVVPRGVKLHHRHLPDWLRVRTRAHTRSASGVVPMLEVAECVVDGASWARTDREAMFVVVSALQQRLTTLQAVAAVLGDRTRVPRGAVVRHILAEFSEGATSTGELDLRRGCRERGLPLPRGQRKRRDADGNVRSIDFEFLAADGVLVVLEVDGIGHISPETWIADMRRQRGLLVPDGTRFLRASTWELRYEPDDVFESLARALRVGDDGM
jgi:hypothetical protein